MDEQTAVTPQEALKFYLRNQEQVDLREVIKSFAVGETDAFMEFLAELTGKTPTQISAAMVKNQPALFMRHATGNHMKFAAARSILSDLTLNPIQKVSAIKKMREAWGLGMRDAKDIVDLLQHDLGVLGKIPQYSYSTPLSSFSSEMRAAYDYVKRHF